MFISKYDIECEVKMSCMPVLNNNGSYSRAGGACGSKLRKILTKKEGQPPNDKRYVVRHLCKNDSYAHKIGKSNFVCGNPEHITWGTYAENSSDIDKNVVKECYRKIAASAMKNGTHSSLVKIQCPHCGKTGQLIGMKRYHFDNCKHKPISLTSSLDTAISFDLSCLENLENELS